MSKKLKLLVLWTTTDCNLRCHYCYANSGDESRCMDWCVAEQALDLMLSQSEDFKIQFAGGEPLLNLDLIEQVVRYTQNYGLSYQLQTNATLIDSTVAQRLKQLGVAVGVSLDGLPAVNDPLRPFADGRGSTSATVAGIGHLREVGIQVGLTCVLSADNVVGLPSLVEMTSYLGNVVGISLDLLRPIGKAKENSVQEADPGLAARYLNLALKRADELVLMGGKEIRFREIERMRYLWLTGTKRQHRCYFSACQSLMVKPDGSAYPCASLASFPEFYLGNILEKGFSEKLPAKLEKARQLISPLETCLTCPDYWLCGGPCPAQVYAQRLAGKVKPTECYVKKTFISYIKKEMNYANQIGLSI
jgi:uncharacterized protein